MNKYSTRLILAAIFLMATASLGYAQGSFFGAIYDTDHTSIPVNQNLYAGKEEVYLNGGPQNDNANGLPVGIYFFQVTDPSGSVLLSTDPALCRQLVVGLDPNGKGRIMGAFGSRPANCTDGTLYPVDSVPAGFPGTHISTDSDPMTSGSQPNPDNGSTGVQLMPYNNTPNGGGEYKVWLIRQATTTTVDVDGIHINFLNSNVRTDNFKIRLCTENCGGGGEVVSISGMKYYDANANGAKDTGEVGIEGFKIIVTINDPNYPDPIIVFTDLTGNWSVNDIPEGAEYSVVEELPAICLGDDSTWVQTGPVADSNGFQGYEGIADVNVENLDFGNICEHPGTGGLTLGFWSNKNGEKTMGSAMGVDPSVYPVATPGPETGSAMDRDLAFLRRLNLRGDASSKQSASTIEFNPTAYIPFRTWILSANAYNMSYMLSAQLAATSLNVRHTKLSDNQLVDARTVCNSIGTCLGFITIGQVRHLADISLGAVGGNTTISGDPYRDSQELMKNFLDKINNNLLPFVSATPCAVCYPIQ